MTSEESKLEILRKVEDGTLSVEEGSDLIGILEAAKAASSEPEIIQPPNEPDEPQSKPQQESPGVSGCWKAAWSMILLGGAVMTAFSAYWVYQGYQNAGLGWGFWLSWIPFTIGVFIMIFGWILLESPWLHVRIKTRDAGKLQKIVLSIPLPLKMVSWVFRTFGQYMPPEVREKGVDEMLVEIDRSLKRGEPFQVEVDDKEDGDQVFIYISR